MDLLEIIGTKASKNNSGNDGEILFNYYSKISKMRAICSPNCVQIWKGRDRKTVFCRVSHKKCRAKGETFLCQTL